MELRVVDNNNIIDLDFGMWLLPNLQHELLKQIPKYNLERWDNFFSSSKNVNRLYKKKYESSFILELASKNIICCKTSTGIVFKFRNNVFVPGYDRLSLMTALKTINYGNLTVKSTPIISETFNLFSEKIQEYVEIYYGI